AYARRLPGALAAATRALRLFWVRLRLAERRVKQNAAQLVKRLAGSETDTLAFLGRLSVGAAVSVLYLGASLDGALESFWPNGPRSDTLQSLGAAMAPLRLVSTYHLFGHITRERIEPTLETLEGSTWQAHDLRYKPGDPQRAPPFVAPHQPRVDF